MRAVPSHRSPGRPAWLPGLFGALLWVLPGCTAKTGDLSDDTGDGGTGDGGTGTTVEVDPGFLAPDPDGDPDGWGLYIAQALDLLREQEGAEELTVVGLTFTHSNWSTGEARFAYIKILDPQDERGMWWVTFDLIDPGVEVEFWTFDDMFLSIDFDGALAAAPTQLLLDRQDALDAFAAGPLPPDQYMVHYLHIWSVAMLEAGANNILDIMDLAPALEGTGPREPVIWAKALDAEGKVFSGYAAISGLTGELYGVEYVD